jgi:Leucine-rich repeat (LRR) protein
MPFIAGFSELKELNLEDNYMETLPQDLQNMLPAVENLNLNGNNFDDEKFEEIIDSLVTMRNLKSLFINLHEEE